MQKTLYILALVLINAFHSYGEDVKFSVQVSSKRISMQDFLQVEYLVENSRKVSQFIPPDFSSFSVEEGPEQASGWNMTNGALVEYVSFSYLLKPVKEGRFLIPQATARIDGKIYRTKSLMVEVVASVIPGVTEDMNFAAELVMRKGETVADKVRNNIFVKLDLNKSSCYEGEPVTATYKLYTRLRSESKVLKRPSFNGFSVYDMVNPETEGPYREQYNGREYNVYLLRKVQLYPLQSGPIQLDPIDVENTLTFVKSEELRSGLSLGRVLKNLAEGNEDVAVLREKVILSSTPASIQIKPLPATREAGFNGAVGNFNIQAMVSSQVVKKNDLVNLVIRVSGKGNFPMLASPAVNWPDSTEVFEPSVQEQFSKFVSPISGSKIYNIPFTVQKVGDFVIPAVDLHYFDPQKGSYAVAHSDPISFHVDPAMVNLKKRKISLPAVQPNSSEGLMWVVYIVSFIVVVGSAFLLIRKVGKPEQAKPTTKAAFIAVGSKQEDEENTTLDNIRAAFEKGDTRQFYQELGYIINDCLKKKYNVEDQAGWETALVQKGVDEDMIATIRSMKEDAALAMYTPFVMESKMVEDLARIEKMIC